MLLMIIDFHKKEYNDSSIIGAGSKLLKCIIKKILIKNYTDTLIEQIKKPQEALEFKLNKQMDTFHFPLQLTFLKSRNGY